MIGITKKDVESLKTYFGDFGGMIIPDAFTPEIFSMADEAKGILPSESFNKLFDSIIARLPALEWRELDVDGTRVTLLQSQTKFYIAAGHLALTKLRKIESVSFGSYDTGVVEFVANMCKELSLRLSVTLTGEQAGNAVLKAALEALGCKIDDTSCVNLHNRPHMYSYQRFIGSRANSAFIADGAELGCYPFPALSGLFAEQFGKKIRGIFPKVPEGIAVTMKNGSAAVSAFRGFKGENCKFMTVEEPICQQFYSDSYGGAVIFVRSAKSDEYTHAIAAEICDMWRMAEVARLGAENYYKPYNTGDISECTSRALHIIRSRMPAFKSLLLVEGENE